jgi:uncharacterized protein (DUF1697 family)
MARAMADSWVALLRAVNVAGKNKLPMKELAAIFSGAGCSEVRTYIQSGNVVFCAKPPLARKLAALAGGAIEERFGFSTPVILRSAAELREATARNPFLRAGSDPSTLHVAFLAGEPAAAAVAALDPNRSPPDAFTVRGREIYLMLPNGVGRSKLTNQYFDSRLGTPSTVRNWRTVLALLEMAGG